MNQKISPCNRLMLETVGSRPIMPKNLLRRCLQSLDANMPIMFTITHPNDIVVMNNRPWQLRRSLASPVVRVWKVVGLASILKIIPNNFMARTGQETLVWSGHEPGVRGIEFWGSWGVDHTGQFRQHPSASLVVIVWKVVCQHLFLNMIPNNFMARTGWKVWCDWGMNLVPQENSGHNWSGSQCCNFQVLLVELHAASFGSPITNVVSNPARGPGICGTQVFSLVGVHSSSRMRWTTLNTTLRRRFLVSRVSQIPSFSSSNNYSLI